MTDTASHLVPEQGKLHRALAAVWAFLQAMESTSFDYTLDRIERGGELALFDAILAKTRYVGEIGLDGSPELRPHWQAQLAVFDHILASCIRAGGKIMSLHSRRAATPVLDRLEASPDAGTPILHWFSGSVSELDRAVALGCWFSIATRRCTLLR